MVGNESHASVANEHGHFKAEASEHAKKYHSEEKLKSSRMI